ncbi:MAG TPA: LppX_LprAFG lipoprotein [Thermomicrobiales bacterium]|nr:LppX_LprAFG lipoprotein [Thermomicrobiales bacterium]
MRSHDDHTETWSHPLIRTLDRPMSRRMFALGSAGVLGVATARPALRLVSAQEASPQATPGVEVTGEQDAVDLLNAAAKAMAELDTFAFELETTRGTSTVLQGLELKKIEGVVRRPMDVKATLTIGVPFGDIDVTAIGVNGAYWVEDPLSAGGTWMSLGSDPQLGSVINPDALILLAVRLVNDARVTGNEKLDGAETTVVEGTVDFVVTAGKVMGDTSELRGIIAEGEKDVTFWIDDQNRVVEAEIRGPLLAAESDDVVRVLRIYDFNKPVEIETPPAS